MIRGRACIKIIAIASIFLFVLQNLFFQNYKKIQVQKAPVKKAALIDFLDFEISFDPSLPFVLRLAEPTYQLSYPYNEKNRRLNNYLMPAPFDIQFEEGDSYIELSEDDGIQFLIDNCPYKIVENAIHRFFWRLNNYTGWNIQDGKGTNPLSIKISCNFDEKNLQLGVDEEYNLSVRVYEAELHANSTIGILRGLESLSQLIMHKQSLKLIAIPIVKIHGNSRFSLIENEDFPKYPWRGLLIDISRHFFPKEELKILLEGMAVLKLNTLHLHFSDDQGFRIEIKKYPKLHELGGQGVYLTQEDIKELVEFAKERGIRIVPELEMPGHVGSWLVGYPEIGPLNLRPKAPEIHYGIFDYVLNPFKNETYEIISDIISELATLFPDEYIHIGGDEVDGTQWYKDPSMKNQSENYYIEELQLMFTNRVIQIINSVNKKAIGWQEVGHNLLNKSAIILQGWRGNGPSKIIRNGFRLVTSKNYYLDFAYQSCTYFLHQIIQNSTYDHLSLGGEACMWSEFVDNTTLHQKIFPTLGTISERYWSHTETFESMEDNYLAPILREMYVRLDILNNYLSSIGIGLRHKDFYQPFIRELISKASKKLDMTQVNVLVDTLSTLARLGSNYTVHTPLNKLTDVIYPESLTIRRFDDLIYKIFTDPNTDHEKKDLHLREMKECLNDWIHASEYIETTLGKYNHSHEEHELDALQLFAPMIRELSECSLRVLSQSSDDECAVKLYEYCKISHRRIFMGLCDPLSRIILQKAAGEYVPIDCKVFPEADEITTFEVPS